MGKITAGTWGFGPGSRPPKAGPGRPKGSRKPRAAHSEPTGFALNPRRGPGRPKVGRKAAGATDVRRRVVEATRAVPSESTTNPIDRKMQLADHYWEIGQHMEQEKPHSGEKYLDKADRIYTECAPYKVSRQAPVQPSVPKSDVPNVVRVPLPAQSAEAWQAEADLWRAQQAKFKVGDSGPTIN